MSRYMTWIFARKVLIGSHLQNLRTRLSGSYGFKLAKWQLVTSLFWTRTKILLGNVAISLFAVSAAALVLSMQVLRLTLNNFNPLETILAQLGATFGTILALVLTLSIIPIQRAGEVWSPVVVRLYRHDPATKAIFIVLGVLCVGSFLLAIKGLAGISVSVAFAAAIALLGVSLDLLRWYHGQFADFSNQIRRST